jgi:hypothetical protein
MILGCFKGTEKNHEQTLRIISQLSDLQTAATKPDAILVTLPLQDSRERVRVDMIQGSEERRAERALRNARASVWDQDLSGWGV